MVPAIVLAGTPKAKRRMIQGRNKFFVKINNVCLGDSVVNVLSKMNTITSITIVGDKSELERTKSASVAYQIIQEKGDFYTNAMDAFHRIPGCEDLGKQVLYVACDMPFLSSQAVKDFLLHAPEADLIFTYCLREDFEDLFRGYKWPYQVYAEGEVKFGNIGLVKPNQIRNKELLRKFFALRKVSISHHRKEEVENIPRVMLEALKLKGVEGAEIVAREIFLKYIAGPLRLRTSAAKVLPLRRIEKIFSELLNCQMKTIRTQYPELCYDVDNEDKDLAYAIQNRERIQNRIRSR